MSYTRTLTEDSNSIAGATGYVKGDKDPDLFDYNLPLTNAELLYLFLRNSKMKKACAWYASEIMRERWEFDKDEPITGTKHGTDYAFKTFNDWLEWCGFMQEVLKAVAWSLLFGEAILVFYDGKEETSTKWQKTEALYLKGGEKFVKCKAFYEEIDQNGYYIEQHNNFFGNPETYRITLTAYKATKSIVYYVDAATRVVRFTAPAWQLKFAGTSSCSTISKDCHIQEMIKRGTAIQLMNVTGGILAVRVSGEAEKTLIEAELGTTLTHLKRIYASGNMAIDEMLKLIVPDLRMDQVVVANELIQQDIATGIDMSISNLEGAPQGALSSAEYDTFNTYSKVKQLQAHYKRAFEESFFKLGKKDTSFTFYDPTPMQQQQQVNPDGTNSTTTGVTSGPGKEGSGNTKDGQREGTNN